MMRSKVKWTLIIILVLTMIIVGSNEKVSAGIADEKFLGNITAGYIPSDFGEYWDQVTPENSTKWGSV